MAVPAPAPAEIERVPHWTVPSIIEVPLAASVQIPGQEIDPSSQRLTEDPVIAIWPEFPASQMRVFQHDRSPVGHHELAAQLLSPGGASEQGAANHVKPPPDAGSNGALEGHAEIEHGSEPNPHEPAQAVPPSAQLPDEKLAWLTNSRVTSRAMSRLPFRQMPPTPGDPEPLK
jgi:hypothetical protein